MKKQSILKLNLIMPWLVISLTLLALTKCASIAMSKDSKLWTLEKFSAQCMVTNCIECEPNMPFTCSKCEPNKSCYPANCQSCSQSDPTECMKCHQEYNYNKTTKNCELIQSCGRQNYCSTCSQDGVTCITCNVGFNLNPYTHQCTKCPIDCLSCNLAMQCQSCYDHHFLTNGQCLQCDLNCLTCQQTKEHCTSCDPTKYLDIQTSICMNCMTNCLFCIEANSCKQCLDHYFYDEQTSSCQMCGQYCFYCKSVAQCITCQQGYFLNETTKYCNTCDQIIPHCQICINQGQIYQDQNYTTTKNSFLQIKSSIGFINGVQCKKCLQGYYPNNPENCAPCLPNCKQCTNNTYCIQCQNGYVINPQTYFCDLCNLANCIVCQTANICKVCKIGYFWNNISHAQFATCERCRQGCSSCGVNYCTQCDRQFYLINQTCLRCSQQCGTCQKSASRCTICSVGYFLVLRSNKCLRCPNKCLKCTSYQSCQQCIAGYRMVSENQCTPCQIQNCSYCFFSQQDNKQYCLQCMIQNYLIGNTTCRPCMQGCKYCNSETNCQSCIDKYFLNITSQKCEKCPQKCAMCSTQVQTNQFRCLNCIDFYYKNQDQQCVKCQIENCHRCLNDKVCFECVDGFYLNQNMTCSKCNQSCATCSSQSYCSSCKIGFYITQELECKQCNEGCRYCNDSGQCVMCDYGYRYDNITDKCTPCSTKYCADCLQNKEDCTKCLPGYQLEEVDSTELKSYENHAQQTKTKICFSCGQQLLLGCSLCSSSTKCLSCIQGYEFNQRNLCEIKAQILWPWVLVVVVLCVILLTLIIRKLSISLKNKRLSQILSRKSNPNPQNYKRLQEFII